MPTHPLPPVPVNTVSGLNGKIPTVWDASWQIYTDLSPAQIAAFMAMPQWQAFDASYQAWLANPVGPAPSLTVQVAQAASAKPVIMQ